MTTLHYEDDQFLEKTSIEQFFDSTTLTRLFSFRALCNGAKAAAIEMSVWFLRQVRQVSRLSILDIGSGRGGDLSKWSRLRPRAYIGLDVSRESVKEARDRYSSLVGGGRVATHARFECCDASHERFPVDVEHSIDIVSCQFSLQFFFADEASLTHLLDEVDRCIAPNGILVATFPDGDRISSEMCRTVEAPSIVIGHFLFRRFQRTMSMMPNESPFGIPYSFTLGDAPPCLEYIVFAKFLTHILEQRNYEPCFQEQYSINAQRFYTEHSVVQETTKALLRGKWSSSQDWESLSAFRVLLARKKADPEVVDTDVQAAPPKSKKRKKTKAA